MNELKANPLRPKEVKDPIKRKELAEIICTMIEDGETAKGSALKARWEACERGYRGQPDEEQGLKVTEDSQPHAANIIKPRIDGLVTKVCNPITSQRPYFSAFGYSNDRSRVKANEDSVQFLIERASFARKFRDATRVSCMAAPAILKVPFSIELSSFLAGQSEESQDLSEPFKYVGPRIDVIHPNDFVCYPLTMGGIHRARLVGDRTARRCKEVKEQQKLGIYFDTETMYGGDDPQSWHSGRDPEWSLTNEASGISDADDEMVEIWDVIFKHDLNKDGYEERYRAVVARTQRVLLEFESYGAMLKPEPVPALAMDEMGNPVMDPMTGLPAMTLEEQPEEFVEYSRPWYFPHAIAMPGHNEFFHSTPIVQDLMPLQADYSDGMTLLIEGGKMMAFPAGFVKGGKLTDQVKRYRPGEYHYLAADQEIVFADPKFNPSVWPLIFQLIKDDADALVRFSKNGTAQSTGSTASEAVIVNNNVEEGADEYRDIAAMAPEEMCDFIRELAYIHYGLLKEVYAEQFPCEDREMLRKPLRWEATGKTADTNPQVLGQNVQEILAMLQNPIALQAMAASGINLSALIKGWLKTKRWPVPDSDLFPNEQLSLDQQTAQPPALGGMETGLGVPAIPPGAGDPNMQGGGFGA